jgi:hypothetical protein
MLGRREKTLGVPAFCFFGGGKKKNERGMRKEGASSNARRKQTWEAQKLWRAKASLQFET